MNIIFSFLSQNICCGYSKEPFQRDGSLKHPLYMLKSMGKKILTNFTQKKNVFLISKSVLKTKWASPCNDGVCRMLET